MKIRELCSFVAVALLFAIAAPAGAQAQSGLLTKAVRLPALTLASGKPLAEAPYELEAGKHYRLPIKADGTAELAIVGPEFFRNMWINEIVVNKVEIRPLGLDSIEFDDAGEAVISFVLIRPGKFIVRIPGTTADSQSAVFNVK